MVDIDFLAVLAHRVKVNVMLSNITFLFFLYLGFTVTMVKTIVFAIIFIIILWHFFSSISTKLHR